MTKLERAIAKDWERLILSGNQSPSNREEYTERELGRTAEWDRLLALAFDGQRWLVSSETASMLSTGRWSHAMALREYQRAEQEIERSLRHPKHDPWCSRIDLPMLFLARLAQGRDAEACMDLEKLIESGPESPDKMGIEIVHLFLGSLEDIDSYGEVSGPVLSLTISIAKARDASADSLTNLEVATSRRDLAQALRSIVWPEPRPAKPEKSKQQIEAESAFWAAWHASVFRGGYYDGGQPGHSFRENERNRSDEWDRILALAFDGKAWLVDHRAANAVSHGRWYNAMILKEYDRAEAELTRLETHPEQPHRFVAVSNEIDREIARLAQGRDQEAVKNLRALMKRDRYSRDVTLENFLPHLGALLEDMDGEAALSSALQELVAEMALAKRKSKRIVDRIRSLKTNGELAGVISNWIW